MKADAGRKRTSVFVVGGIIFLLTIVLSAILNSDSYPFVTNFLVDMGVFIGLGFLATILSGERGFNAALVGLAWCGRDRGAREPDPSTDRSGTRYRLPPLPGLA